MRTVMIGTTGAIALVLAGTLAWNAEATPKKNAPLSCTYPQCIVCIDGTWYCRNVKGVPPNRCPPVHCIKKPK
jgi:hypothetical protein